MSRLSFFLCFTPCNTCSYLDGVTLEYRMGFWACVFLCDSSSIFSWNEIGKFLSSALSYRISATDNNGNISIICMVCVSEKRSSNLDSIYKTHILFNMRKQMLKSEVGSYMTHPMICNAQRIKVNTFVYCLQLSKTFLFLL